MGQGFEEKITYILGNEEELRRIGENSPFVPFSDETMRFLTALSERIFESGEIRNMPEAASFAFWCREAHLQQLKREYRSDGETRLGRGVSLHFAPSNMPVLFAFSLAAGLLAGNSVVVRLPGAESAQEEMIVRETEALLARDFLQFRGRMILCRYAHDREITDGLSKLCDVRVIWGSDASVSEIRKSPLKPRAVELPFASRGSAAILCAGKVNETKDIDLLARVFYNDTYLNDQNACSSPRMIYWLGTKQEVKTAREKFWTAIRDVLEEKDYQVPASVAVRKLDAALMMAAAFENVQIYRETNRIVRVRVPELCREMWDYTVPGGFFLESEGEDVKGMADILNGYCQTLCAFGVDEKGLAKNFADWRLSGVDRIVPMGHALDFSLTWDGFNLIEAMSRRIYAG